MTTNETTPSADPPGSSGRGLWIAGGSAVAVLALVSILLWWGPRRGADSESAPARPAAELQRGTPAPEPPPDEQELHQLVERLVEERLAERESAIRRELLDQRSRIEELQRRQDQLLRAIDDSEAERRRRETELAEVRRQLDEAMRRSIEPPPSPTSGAAEVEAPPAEPGSGPSPSPTAVMTADGFVDPSEVDTLPVVTRTHPVSWSRLALHSRRQGIVIVQATVDATGRVEEVRVLRADHDGFGIPQAVMQAVRRYQFEPATKNGVPVKSNATVAKHYRFR